MKRPNFQSFFDAIMCSESTDPKPIETFIPNQSMKLSELMTRFEHGQRLNVHQFPMNKFFADEETANANSERFEDAPPDDVHDIADVERYYRDHVDHKREFSERMKKKKQAKQEAPKEAPSQAPQAPPSASE